MRRELCAGGAFERRRRLMDDRADYLAREPRTEGRGAAGQLSLMFDAP